MPPVVEVYNRVVQCQASQRCERRGRRRRHLSEQNIKSEAPTHTDAVQVRLEFGHRAILRSRPTQEGFTHDWVVYVRGADANNIQHFVDKVVFHLHESFPKSTRVVKEPPYQVAETGYGGFTMPIDVYVKNNGEPKKIRFQYELFLGTVGMVTHNRCEKITFQQPSSLFRERLVNGGAITPESNVLVLRESEESSSSDSRSSGSDAQLQSTDARRPASAPLPALNDGRDVDKYAYGSGEEFSSRAPTTAKVVAAGSRLHEIESERPLSFLQRRLHCRVALSSACPTSPVRHDVPAASAAATERTTTPDSDDVIVVGCGWTSDAKRGAKMVQPKLEPGVYPATVRATTSTQLTTAVKHPPRHDVWNNRHREGTESTSHFVQPEPARETVVQSSSDRQRQDQQDVEEPVVKRGRGRPRKYPRKATKMNQQTNRTAAPVTVHRSSRDVVNRFVDDKENISPRSVAVSASKCLFDEQDRNIWTSNTVRDASKLVQASEAAGLHQRQRLSELPVNVVLSNENNNFQKKPTDKMASNFWLKDLDKDKLKSVWNTLRGTLQSGDRDAISGKTDSAKSQTAEQRGVPTKAIADRSQEKVDSRSIQHQRPGELRQKPVVELEPTSNKDSQCQHTASKTVHWKCPEVDDVKQHPVKISNTDYVDDLMAGDSLKTNVLLVEDIDEKLPLPESVGKPLFTSTPIKLTEVPTSTSTAPVAAKRARVRFRPMTQVLHDDDEEDEGDRVELSKLAALPGMRHGAVTGAVGTSGVRPADIVRAFRTIDDVAAALPLPLPTLALPSHAVVPSLGVASLTSQTHVRSETDRHQAPTDKVINSCQSTASVSDENVVAEDKFPMTTTTSSSDDASPTPSEVVPGALLHFYGTRFDDLPYNVSPSAGGFVTKAARKRPMVDDFGAPDRKRFEPSTSTPVASTIQPPFVRQPDTTIMPAQPEVSQPGTSRLAGEVVPSGDGRVRRAPNGVAVEDLLRLQRQLSSLTDAARLRRVVHIIGETGRYCVNDVTFDFDLCNLDSATVTRLIHCLDSALVH